MYSLLKLANKNYSSRTRTLLGGGVLGVCLIGTRVGFLEGSVVVLLAATVELRSVLDQFCCNGTVFSTNGEVVEMETGCSGIKEGFGRFIGTSGISGFSVFAFTLLAGVSDGV